MAFGLTIIPGLGHVLLDRHTLGVFLFTVFAVSANGAFVGTYLWVNQQQQFLILLPSTVGLLLVYPYAFLQIWRLTFGNDQEARWRGRAIRLRKAVSLYLRGRMDEAEGEIRGLLREEDLDVDCLFYLAMIQRDRGEITKARRTFRRCAALDAKWRWEVDVELGALPRGK